MSRVLVLLLLALPVFGQPAKYHSGDNPAWSAPLFDDSSWGNVEPGKEVQIPIEARGFAWVRARMIAPADKQPLSICHTEAIAQIWINGRYLAQRGQFPPAWNKEVVFGGDARACMAIPSGWIEEGQPLLVVVRLWNQPSIFREGRWKPRSIELRNTALAEAEIGRQKALDRAQAIFELAQASIHLLYGAFLLLLWRITRTTPDIPQFGHMLIVWALLRMPPGVAALVPLSKGVYNLDTAFNAWFGLAILCFAFEVYSVRRRRYRFTFLSLNLLGLLPLIGAIWASEPSRLLEATVQIGSLVPITTLAMTVVGCYRIWRERFSEPITISLTLLFMSQWVAQWQFLPRSFLGLGFRMYLTQLVFWVLTVVMSWFLLRRAWRVWKTERERDAEFQAAREVQSNLLRATEVPGWRIDSVYRPAREVGGDFFATLPATEGSLLVVVGDVSGKGLDAAMLASAAVLSLNARGSDQPAEVLAMLNRVFTGQCRGGFVTCCVALLHRGGRMEVANAGHIAPWADGVEISTEPGIPLGISSEAEWGQLSLPVRSGATLTFLSDGVLEATNAHGELLGFERLAGLSAKSAGEIAEEAERWGQEDDITVVQVAYA